MTFNSYVIPNSNSFGGVSILTDIFNSFLAAAFEAAVAFGAAAVVFGAAAAFAGLPLPRVDAVEVEAVPRLLLAFEAGCAKLFSFSAFSASSTLIDVMPAVKAVVLRSPNIASTS